MPSVDELSTEIRTRRLSDIVREFLFQGDPFIFARSPSDYTALRQHLSAQLGITIDKIVVVGSAKLGFSLDPGNYGSPFSSASDVDVILIDDELFDRVWHILLAWHYGRKLVPREGNEQPWAMERRRDVFLGRFALDELRFEGLGLPTVLGPLRDVSTRWFSAFRSISLNPRLAGHEYKGRLYRSWEHALLYHVDGLRQIRRRLTGENGGTE